MKKETVLHVSVFVEFFEVDNPSKENRVVIESFIEDVH